MARKKLTKFLPSLAVLILVGYLVTLYREQFQDLLLKADYKFFCMVFLCQVALIALTGLPFKTLFSALGVNMQTAHWVCLSYAGNFANYTAPLRPDLAVRYVFMKQTYQSSLTDIATVSVSYTFYAFITSLILATILGPFVTQLSSNTFYYPLFWLAACALATICVIKLISLERLTRRLPPKISSTIDKIKSFTSNRSLFVQIIAQFLVINLLSGLTYYFAFHSLSLSPNIAIVLLIAPVSTLAGWFTLTPANIGVTESLVGFLLEYSTGDFSAGFLATSIVRLSHIGVSIIFGGLSSLFLLSRVNQSSSDDE